MALSHVASFSYSAVTEILWTLKGMASTLQGAVVCNLWSASGALGISFCRQQDFFQLWLAFIAGCRSNFYIATAGLTGDPAKA